jgi:Flp pilus assembly protein TadG
MRSDREYSVDSHPERGAVLVMVAVSMVALIGIVALAVDVGYLMVTRNEVQNVADGSALAGARTLGAMYQELPSSQQQTFYCLETCQDSIRNVSQDVATKNWAAGEAMSVRVADVLIGQWDGGSFTETNSLPDAVYVIARRDAAANGPVATFFARVLGIDEAPVSAIAIAAMTGQANVLEGGLLLPVALSRYFFDDTIPCNSHIRFNPTNDPTSCGGWTTWDIGSNTKNLRDILDGNYVSPPIVAGQTVIELTGGNVAAAFDNLLGLYQREGFATNNTDREYLRKDDGSLVQWFEAGDWGGVRWQEVNNQGQLVDTYWLKSNGQPDPTKPRYYHRLDGFVPVYDRDDCSNPNQRELVVGFAAVSILDVRGAPDQQIDGVIQCELVNPEDTRSGGGNFGVKGPIPGLVR